MTAPLPGRLLMTALSLAVLMAAAGGARAESLPDPGYLFYTPAQRAQLEQARARNVTQRAVGERSAEPRAPLRYDGVVIRSDGRSTHWIDGRPHVRPEGAAGLKPGQVRTEGRVYEPYQILRPAPAAPSPEKAAPAAPPPSQREAAESAP